MGRSAREALAMLDSRDLVYQINTHLLYELKWMIFAAHRFEQGGGDVYVALLDSAAVHARNLIEFLSKSKDKRHFTLEALGGSPVKAKRWERFLNNRVTHMREREHAREPWPDGLDNERPDRLMVMADIMLGHLEQGGASIPPSEVKDAFDAVVGAARRYWSNPCEESHQELQQLYDPSRDSRPYSPA